MQMLRDDCVRAQSYIGPLRTEVRTVVLRYSDVTARVVKRTCSEILKHLVEDELKLALRVVTRFASPGFQGEIYFSFANGSG